MSDAVTPPRAFLGRQASVLERNEVYLRPEGFEVDDRSLISLRRRWILFDEVTLVTFHPVRSWAGAVLAGFFALIFGIFGAIVGLADKAAIGAGFVFGGFAAFFALVGVLSLVIPRWTVTIQGRRSRATMAGASRGKMQALYDQTVQIVTAAREPAPPA